MEIEDFQDCGWFLRKKIERPFTSVTNHMLKETLYILEWHGRKACRKVSGDHWSPTAWACSNTLCGEKLNGE